MKIERRITYNLGFLLIIGLFVSANPETLRAQDLNSSVNAANQLLRVTDMARKFESITSQQTLAIIRTYSSIVDSTVGVALPNEIKQSILSCYSQAYAWENFETGIVEILRNNLNAKEVRLLIDFYQSKGLPPTEIETFKETIAKADAIETSSLEYIFANSDGCVEYAADLIADFLAQQQP